MTTNSSAHRISIYTHDAYGVGHIRRSLNIVQALADQDPQVAILLVTGSQSVEWLKGMLDIESTEGAAWAVSDPSYGSSRARP